MSQGRYTKRATRALLGLDDPLVHLVIACGIGALLGTASLLSSPLWVLAALAGGALVLATVKRPEIALLGVLCISSTIIAEENVLVIGVGPLRVYITDAILLALVGLIILRWLAEQDFQLVRTALDLPLIAFFGIALLSTVLAMFQAEFDLGLIGRAIVEVRTVAYYLIFFTVSNLIREERQLLLLLNGLYLLASIVVVAMVAQYLFGQSIRILPGRVETLVTGGAVHGGVTRITNFSGEGIVLVALIAKTAILSVSKFKPIRLIEFCQWGLLAFAVALTFNRNFWVVVLLSVSLTALLIKGQDRRRFLGWALLGVVILGVALLLVFTTPDSKVANLVSASFERLTSLFNAETYASEDSTFKWRAFEYGYAFQQFATHPLLGIGLGAKYRPFVPGIDWEGFDGRAYTHNAHMWILVKTGLLGYLCLAWLSIRFLVRSFKHWRQMDEPLIQGSMLGFALAYLGVIIGSIVNPMFMQWYWAPVIGVMMGANEVAIRQHIQKRASQLDMNTSEVTHTAR